MGNREWRETVACWVNKRVEVLINTTSAAAAIAITIVDLGRDRVYVIKWRSSLVFYCCFLLFSSPQARLYPCQWLEIDSDIRAKTSTEMLGRDFLGKCDHKYSSNNSTGQKSYFDDQLEIKSCKAGRLIALQAKKYISSIAKFNFGFWNIAKFYFICNSEENCKSNQIV